MYDHISKQTELRVFEMFLPWCNPHFGRGACLVFPTGRHQFPDPESPSGEYSAKLLLHNDHDAHDARIYMPIALSE